MESIHLHFTFFVNHFTAISYFSPVNWCNFLINCLETILLCSQYDISNSRNGFLTSNIFGGIINNSSLSKVVKSLFPLIDCNLHPSCKIYKGICSCGETCIGETIRNVEERLSEHNSSDNKSEPAKHLPDNKEHSFLWSILLAAPKDGRTH